ncbi:MAG: hypothetical protein ACJAS1_003407, partial [Oleiphilaceae bacterium]|jgi:uncharacterized protein YceK
MKLIFIVLFYLVVSGCSTVHTINNANDGVVMKGTYCKNIDHVFSGIEYNWCKLHGTPNSNADPRSSKGDFEYVGIDSFFSFIGDVIALPYTIYMQVSSDPIAVHSAER